MKKTENKSGKSGMQVMKKLMAFIAVSYTHLYTSDAADE